MTISKQNAAAVWAALTAGEREALAASDDRKTYYIATVFERNLESQGLVKIVRIDHTRHCLDITDFGKRVLAAGTAASQPDSKQITAAEWPTVAADVAAGRVVVRDCVKRRGN